MKKQLTALAIVLCLLLTLLAGCGSGNGSSADTTENAEAPTSASVPAEDGSEAVSEPENSDDSAETVSYFPLAETATISMWTAFPPIFPDGSSPEDYLIFTEAMDRLNVELDITAVSLLTAGDAFNIMLSGGEYTDIINNFTNFYTSSAATALDEDIIVDLTDVIDEYAPDYQALRTADEKTASLTEDDGHILRFFMLYSGSGYTDFGPAIRQDWLDALGMDAPVTYDQWYDTISAFNTEYGATLAIPATATVSYGFLCSAYDLELPTSDGGANDGFYVVDGEVHYGPYEENLYDYLDTLHTWYEEGLVNPNFMTSQNGAQTDTDLITNNTCGIFFMSYNRFTEYEEQMESGASIQAISDALLTEGQTTHIRPLTEPVGNIVISSTCENVELAVRFMNWWYTEEGIELANYGVEGLSFNYGDDGSIVWTELVSDNETLSLDAALAMYTGSRDSITYYYDNDKFDTLYDERQINAGKLWRSTDDGAYAMPSSFDFSCDKEAQDLMTDILTYVNENIVQFVIGSRSLDEFDDYIAQLKDMGIEDVLTIYTNEYSEKYA